MIILHPSVFIDALISRVSHYVEEGRVDPFGEVAPTSEQAVEILSVYARIQSLHGEFAHIESTKPGTIEHFCSGIESAGTALADASQTQLLAFSEANWMSGMETYKSEVMDSLLSEDDLVCREADAKALIEPLDSHLLALWSIKKLGCWREELSAVHASLCRCDAARIEDAWAFHPISGDAGEMVAQLRNDLPTLHPELWLLYTFHMQIADEMAVMEREFASPILPVKAAASPTHPVVDVPHAPFRIVDLMERIKGAGIPTTDTGSRVLAAADSEEEARLRDQIARTTSIHLHSLPPSEPELSLTFSVPGTLDEHATITVSLSDPSGEPTWEGTLHLGGAFAIAVEEGVGSVPASSLGALDGNEMLSFTDPHGRSWQFHLHTTNGRDA